MLDGFHIQPVMPAICS